MTQPKSLLQMRDDQVLKAYDVFDGHLTGEQANFIRGTFDSGTKAVIERASVLVDTLLLISKNNTDDCDIYTMGCECDEEAKKALAEWENFIKGESK